MSRLDFVCRMLHALVLACVVSQLWIDPAYENTLSVLMTAFATTVLVEYIRRSRPFDDAPLSSLALLGYCVTSQLASLVAQSAQWTAYIELLRVPVTTFGILASVQLMAILVHYVYRQFEPLTALRDRTAATLLTPLGIHAVPQPVALWCMSSVGVAALLQGGAQFGDVSGKALQALEFMTWLPFLILVYHRQFGEAYCSFKKQAPLVLLYASMVFVVGMARNARSLMFIGPMIAILLYLMVSVRAPGPMPRKSIIKVAAGVLLAGMAVVVVADLVTAMVVTRDKRETSTRWEMVQETYHALTDRTRIQAYRDAGYLDTVMKPYDEIYLSNPVLARFSETKFHDNMFYFGGRFGDRERDDLIEEVGMQILVLMPQPLIDWLGLNIKKWEYSYSMGDFYVDADHGGGVGAYFTGSIWADLVVMFGVFMPFVAMLIMLLTFMLLDALTRLNGAFFISPVGMCMAWIIFIYGVGGPSVSSKVAFFVRETPQKIVLYAIVFWVVQLFIRQARFTPPSPPVVVVQ
jgi:hypothetical protein